MGAVRLRLSKRRRPTIARAIIPRGCPTGGHRHQRLLPLSPFPATPPAAPPAAPYVEQLNIGAGRRTLAIGLAIAIAGLMLLLLLSWGAEKPPGKKDEFVSVVSLEATEMPNDAADESQPQPAQAEEQAPSPEPVPDQPQPLQHPAPLPPPPVVPKAAPPIAPPASPAPANPPIAARPPTGRVYGPPNTGGSPASRDSERVGTAPNGEPLYAAAWYREPSDDELRGYLSTASGPGWGLIACRTAPDYRVEDCVGLDEYPAGSQIERAVLAAAWQFKVRPPRVGGRSMVGAWVRIRIDYGTRRR